MDEIKLGLEVKDKISGFTGIAEARVIYLNGCVQYQVTPPVDKDGNRRKCSWIDESSLEITGNGINDKSEKPEDSGTGGGLRSHPDD